jgi:hypothetical protein
MRLLFIENPLIWWVSHACLAIFNVSFLACQVIGIVGSQIEIE